MILPLACTCIRLDLGTCTPHRAHTPSRSRPLLAILETTDGIDLPLPLTEELLDDSESHATLFEHAMQNAGATRATRFELRAALRLVRFDDERRLAAAESFLFSALSHAYGGQEADRVAAKTLRHAHTQTDEAQAQEYHRWFAPQGYSIAGSELTADGAVRLLALLRLSPADTFVDLGCATGRLTLAAAQLSRCSAVGVELSPSRHARGAAALRRLDELRSAPAGGIAAADAADAAGVAGVADTAGAAGVAGAASDSPLGERVRLLCGDVLEAPLAGATVVWCAVRPSSGRRLGAQLAANLRAQLPPGGSARLLLAGFALPPRVEGATLSAAYVFATGGDDAGPEEVVQLYGGRLGGPSVVLEYRVLAGE